jgi:hypothetical protein
MTINKPDVVAYRYINKDNPVLRGVSLHHDASCTSTLITPEPLIRLSDYEALQAKCERLVEALTELCDEIDKHEIHVAISKTSISWFKRKAREALAAQQQEDRGDE